MRVIGECRKSKIKRRKEGSRTTRAKARVERMQLDAIHSNQTVNRSTHVQAKLQFVKCLGGTPNVFCTFHNYETFSL